MAKDPIHKEVLQDGRTRWWFRVGMKDPKTGKYLRPRFTFDSKKEASTRRAELIAERGHGLSVVPSKITVAEWVERWLGAKKSEVKPNTLRHYRDSLQPVVIRWGHLPLQKLDTTHLETTKDEMLSGVARRVGAGTSAKARKAGQAAAPMTPRSVNATLVAVTATLQDALHQKVVYINVGKAVKRVRKGRTNTREKRGAWQPDHSVAFLRSVADDRLVGAWWLSMLGMRRGEVVGLRWSAIDLEEGTLMIENNRLVTAGEVYEDTPKSEASERPLPIPAPALDALRRTKTAQAAERLAAGVAYTSTDHGPRGTLELYAEAVARGEKNKAAWIAEQLRDQGEEITEDGVHSRIVRARKAGTLPTAPYVGNTGLVVVDEIGQPIRPERYSDMFVAAAATADLPRIPLHGCRHAAASLLADCGVPIVVAARWLGQSQTSITEAYQWAFAESMKDAGEKLGNRLAGIR